MTGHVTICGDVRKYRTGEECVKIVEEQLKLLGYMFEDVRVRKRLEREDCVKMDSFESELSAAMGENEAGRSL